jgi:hypothetical protein
LGRPRSCGRPYVIHPIRTSVLAKELGFDKNSGKPENYFTALLLFHDTIEEFLHTLKDKRGQIIYGLENIFGLMKQFIPKDMYDDALALTNIPDMVIDHLVANKYRLETKKEIKLGLESVLNDKKCKFVHEYIHEMIKVLDNAHIKSKVNIKSGTETVKEDALWEFYSRIYLTGLGEQAINSNNYGAFKSKGLDLYDNCGSIEAEKFKSKRRVILKSKFWVDKGDEIIVNKPQSDIYLFKKTIDEIMNFANFSAQEFIVDYLARPVSESSHFETGLKSIRLLKSVLYTKDT